MNKLSVASILSLILEFPFTIKQRRITIIGGECLLIPVTSKVLNMQPTILLVLLLDQTISCRFHHTSLL